MSAAPAPFEVIPVPGGFSWRLIGPCGRTLAYTADSFPTDFAAADAAKAARAVMHERAVRVDGECPL